MATDVEFKSGKDEDALMLEDRNPEANGVANGDHEDMDDDDKKGSIQKKKEEYIQSFTVHGVSRVFDGGRGETSFWCSIVIIGIAVTTYGVWCLVAKYYAYEIYTALSSKITNENPFPAITFCDKRQMISNYFAYCGQPQSAPYANANAPCSYLPKDPPDITNILQKEWSSGKFHVRKCFSWGSRMCANDMYLKSLRRHNHSCFTWNYNGNFFDTYAHAKIVFSTSAGTGEIVAAVHDHRISELELMHQVALSTKYDYTFNIRKSLSVRLPPPFPSMCTYGSKHDIFPGKYTRTTCVESINSMNILKHCGDTIDYAKRLIKPDDRRKYKLEKNLSITETIKCMKKYSQTTVVQSTDTCPVPCEELKLMTMSTKSDSKDITTYTVDVQLQDVESYQIITEHQVFTWDQLAGGVGGFLGLMIGASLVSVVEILVYLCLCLIQKCCKTCK